MRFSLFRTSLISFVFSLLCASVSLWLIFWIKQAKSILTVIPRLLMVRPL